MNDPGGVQDINPDENLLGEIDSRNKEFVTRLYQVFSGVSLQNRTEPMVKELLVDRFEDKVRDFIRQYERLAERNINRRYAEEFLEAEFDVPREDLDTSDRWELLLVIYEHDLQDHLDTIMFRSELFAVKNDRAFYLDRVLNLSNIESKSDGFMVHANVEEAVLDPLHTTVEVHEGIASIQIQCEYGRKFHRTFEFRANGEQSPPPKPTVTGEQYYPLKSIGISIEPTANHTKIIFTKDPVENGWKREITSFFDYVYGIEEIFEELEHERSEVIESILRGAKEAAESEEPTADALQELIEDTKDRKKEELSELGLPDEEKEEYEAKFDSIQLIGYSITDDQSTSTEEFMIIASDLDNLFKTVDGIETSFQDYLEKADVDNIELILRIEGERVQFRHGDWSPMSGRISDPNKEALQLFVKSLNES